MNKAFDFDISPLYSNFSKHVESFIVRDQKNNLDLYLEESTPLQYSSENAHAFVKKPTVPLPELLSSFLQQPGLCCKLGSLPSINHVWFSTKNSLFLWNLNHKDSDLLFRYDSNEAIENVDIVNLPSHKELLISTQNTVYLHAIHQDDPSQKIKLVSKNTTRSYGAVMSNVVTSNTGRVFMKGNDGHLYELLLQVTDTAVTSCTLSCRTLNRLLYYLPSTIFKSRPTEGVRSFVLDDAAKYLFLLLSDSSICAVNIQGDQYLPYQRYTEKKYHLESIHLVSSGKDKSKLMAISNHGDRLFYVFEEPAITFQYSRPAPPISGSLLFNRLSQESVDMSFYRHQGVVANVLGKSERSYLVFTAADIIAKADGTHHIIEDVYHEQIQHKVWSILDHTLNDGNPSSSKAASKVANSPISIITESGITPYIKQRPVEYLEEALLNSETSSILLNVIQRYGALETTYLAYVLACSNEQSCQKVNNFIHQSSTKEEALLLYFSRTVTDVWGMDIKQTSISNDELVSIRTDLKVLLNTIYHSQIPIKEEMVALINRSIESISLICFMRELNWKAILQELNTTFPEPLSFADFVTTQNGHRVAQTLVFTAIEKYPASKEEHPYSHIGHFIHDHCLALFGSDVITYFKAIECLYCAHEQALQISLQHLLLIIGQVDLVRLATIGQKNCDLGNYDAAVALAVAKYVSKTASLDDIHGILFSAIQQALEDEEKGRAVVVKALQLGSHDDLYQFEIFRWLLHNHHKHLLISLETTRLVPFIETQMNSRAESLACLEAYYSYRKQYSTSIRCLYELASETEGLNLKSRIQVLKKALGYLPMAKNVDKAIAENVQKAFTVAEIQAAMMETLGGDELDHALLSDKELLEEFAYTHSLYEEALLLLDLMDIYNWNYVKEAWNHIIKSCSHETEAKEKVKELAERLYPSIASFPVYTIYQILHEYYNKETAGSILQNAGVPHEVVSDAEKTVN